MGRTCLLERIMDDAFVPSGICNYWRGHRVVIVEMGLNSRKFNIIVPLFKHPVRFRQGRPSHAATRRGSNFFPPCWTVPDSFCVQEFACSIIAMWPDLHHVGIPQDAWQPRSKSPFIVLTRLYRLTTPPSCHQSVLAKTAAVADACPSYHPTDGHMPLCPSERYVSVYVSSPVASTRWSPQSETSFQAVL